MTGMRSDIAVSPGGPRLAGLVLAAGAGTRYGGPKALVVDPAGEPWLVRAALSLAEAGCNPVLVVLGAGGTDAETILRASADRFEIFDRITVVHATDWVDGLSASVAAGLDALAALDTLAARVAPTEPATGTAVPTGAPVTAVVLVPVDVPDLNPAMVRRVADAATPATLRQAEFSGRPGHPVVIGRDHWPALRTALRTDLRGDTGARPYLLAHGVYPVNCDDLGTGLDVDTPAG
jgi:CTP:molybdopterin cytidylyltransferase MocA